MRFISSPARSASHAWQCQDAGQRRSAARELQGGVLRRVPRGCGVQSRRFRCGVGAVLAQVQYRRREAAVVRRCFVLGDTRMNIDITPVSGSGSNEERPASLGSWAPVRKSPARPPLSDASTIRRFHPSALPSAPARLCCGVSSPQPSSPPLHQSYQQWEAFVVTTTMRTTHSSRTLDSRATPGQRALIL